MIKAIFIDIDDTLLNNKKEVSNNTKKAIENCMKNDIKIILTSGRSREATLNYQQKIGTSPYIISSNGADVYDLENKKNIYNNPIQKEMIKILFEYSQKHNCKINFNYGFKLVMNKMYYPDEEEKVRTNEELIEIINKENIVQCVIFNKDIEKMRELKKYMKQYEKDVKIESESKRLKNPELEPKKHYYCDITALSTSKGEAVKKMCQYLGLKQEEIAVIGDGENDISMFEVTENSVAMGNSMDEIKEKASFVTDNNNNEGVAKVLKEVLKIKLNSKKW